MPRRRQQPRSGRRSPLWARVCVPGLECTGGRAPGAGGFVWDVSIFYKTTTRINHRLRPCRGNNTGMWLSLPKPVSAIVPDDVQCLGRARSPWRGTWGWVVLPAVSSGCSSAGEALPAVKILVIRPGWLSTASPQCELITPSSGPCDILSFTMFTLFLLC